MLKILVVSKKCHFFIESMMIDIKAIKFIRLYSNIVGIKGCFGMNPKLRFGAGGEAPEILEFFCKANINYCNFIIFFFSLIFHLIFPLLNTSEKYFKKPPPSAPPPM